ncbi:MAG: pentapeptide repeat-containing protein [Armatimonadetes bacterium]|nr:pentapeptide repeat-containing protein [Armatimonadota bacterium]
MSDRKNYHESCLYLLEEEILGKEGVPPLPDRPPRWDDTILGVSFFKSLLQDAVLENLTLPRTYFGRSEIREVSFRGTDLSESTACWNDFIEVDFSFADLTRADLRASIFERVSFQGAILRDADLRRSWFSGCCFTAADLTGARLNPEFGWVYRLTAAQRAVVDWQPEGPEPEGG